MQIHYERLSMDKCVAWEDGYHDGKRTPIDPRLLIPILTHNAAHIYFESKRSPSREVACLGMVTNKMLPVGLKHPNPQFEARTRELSVIEMINQSPLGVLYLQLYIGNNMSLYENPEMTLESLSSMVGTLPTLTEMASK